MDEYALLMIMCISVLCCVVGGAATYVWHTTNHSATPAPSAAPGTPKPVSRGPTVVPTPKPVKGLVFTRVGVEENASDYSPL